MSAPERRTLVLALLFLTVGWTARLLPTFVCDNCDALSYVEAMPGSDDDVGAESMATPTEASRDGKVHTFKSHNSIRAKAKSLSSPIHLNRASESELQGIKGVGPVLAKRIVDFRSLHGSFKGPKDLDKVQGVGKKKLDNLLPFLIFD